jgi:DNA-binding NarL/FixJ family response regulator
LGSNVTGLTAQLERTARGGKALHRILTAAEQAILGGIGDGSDDQTAAERLNRAATNIGEQRRNLHRKLGLHKGELVISIWMGLFGRHQLVYSLARCMSVVSD